MTGLLGAAWVALVFASLVLPEEARESRPAACAAAAASAMAWGFAVLVMRGRARLPAAWVDRAKRPLSSRSLLVLGAAVGPILSYFALACLRVVAYGPSARSEDR